VALLYSSWRTARGGSAVAAAFAITALAALGRAGDRPVTIPLRVVDAAGDPVAGAEIVVTDSSYVLDVTGRSTIVLATLRSGPEGRVSFSCDDGRLRPSEHYLSFWAVAPGHGVGQWPLSAYVPPNGDDVVVALPPLVDGTLRVLAPDGSPLPGARVTPRMAGKMRATLPESLALRWSAVTDAQGDAHFSALDPSQFGPVQVESERFGTQEFFIREDAHGAPLQVAATGTVAGRIELPDGAPAAHLAIRVADSVLTATQQACSASATFTTDDGGRFVWERAPAGYLMSIELVDETLPFVFPMTTATAVVAGDTPTEFVAKAQPARVVEGRLVVGEDATPLPDAILSLEGVVPPRMVRTGADGSFRFRVTSQVALRIAVYAVPPPAAPVPFGGRDGPAFPIELPVGDGPVTLAPLRVERGATVRGVVKDAAGKAAAGAWLSARPSDEESHRASFARATQCDGEGRFELPGLPLGQSIALDVRRGRESLTDKKRVELTADLDLELTIGVQGRSTPSLLVVDPEGRAVQGAVVTLWSRYLEPRYSVFVDRAGDGGPAAAAAARTDAQGRFTDPSSLLPAHRYRFVADAPGCATGFSDWFDGDTPPAEVKLVIRHLVAVRGRIVDTSGRPVAGARVLQSGDGPVRTQASSGADGSFELAGYAEGPAFVFADAAAFRFAGAAIHAPADGVELVLARQDEPPRRELHAEAPALPRAAELAVADEWATAHLPAAREHPDDGPSVRLFEASVRADPRRGLAAIDHGLFADPWFRDYARRPIARSAFAADVTEGVAIVQSMETAQFRTTGFLDAVEARPDLDRAARHALLLEALANARQVDAPAMKVVMLGNVAAAFARCDDVELARRVFAEASPNADKLGSDDWEEYARGAFAENLAEVDPKRARELADSLKDKREYDRHHGNLAHGMAARDPAAAEALLGQMGETFHRDQLARRVCYRMAPVDLERARRIAAKVGGPQARAQTHLVMARALAEHEQQEESRRELELGLAGLAELSDAGEILTNYDRCAAGLGLAFLPVVELVAPDRVDETFWRALSWRRAPGRCDRGVSSPTAWLLQRDGTIAVAAARYDRAATSHLLARFVPQIAELLASSDEEASALAVAQASIDPNEARRWVDAAAANAKGEARNTRRAYLLSDILLFLVATPQERWDKQMQRNLGLWIVDTED
jgi:protocatechuate 3,4-dioxygenase beta subunit